MSAEAICGAEHPGLDWLDGGSTMHCGLKAGHGGRFHWGGKDGMQPWPMHRGLIHLPGPEALPNDQLGIRPHQGFCNAKTLLGVECDMRWRHAGGLHSNHTGKTWVAK